MLLWDLGSPCGESQGGQGGRTMQSVLLLSACATDLPGKKKNK